MLTKYEGKGKKVAKQSNKWDRAQEFARFFGIIFNNALRTGETAYFTALIGSQLGSDYQAAAGMSMSWRLFFQSPYLATAIATSICASILDGKKIPREKGQQMLRNGQLIGTALVMMTGGASFFIKPMLTFLGQPAEQVELANSYFIPGYILALPVMMQTYFNEKYLFSLKGGWHFLAVLPIQILSLGIYVASPWFDEPDMRFRSMGFGTAAQYLTNFILLESYMAVMFGMKTSQFRFNKKYFKQILKMNFPLFVQIVMELFTVNMDVMLAGLFGGVTGAELYSATLPYVSLLVILTLGIAEAARLLVGNAMGAKNYHVARMWGWGGIFAGTIFSSAIAVGFYFGRDWLARLFLSADAKEADVVSTGWLVFMVSCINIPDLIRNVSTTLVITLGNTWYPVMTNVGSLSIGLGVSALLAYLGGKINGSFFNAAMGVLLGQGIGLTLGNITGLAWVRQSISNKAMELTQKAGYWCGLFSRKTQLEKKKNTNGDIGSIDRRNYDSIPDNNDRRSNDRRSGCFSRFKKCCPCNIL